MLNLANINGDFVCESLRELEDRIAVSSQDPYDDIWLSAGEDYPCLAILVNGNHTCVHYFLNEDGDMWQAIGNNNEKVDFLVGTGDSADVPPDAVIPMEKALECVRQFWNNLERPTYVEWRDV